MIYQHQMGYHLAKYGNFLYRNLDMTLNNYVDI